MCVVNSIETSYWTWNTEKFFYNAAAGGGGNMIQLAVVTFQVFKKSFEAAMCRGGGGREAAVRSSLQWSAAVEPPDRRAPPPSPCKQEHPVSWNGRMEEYRPVLFIRCSAVCSEWLPSGLRGCVQKHPSLKVNQMTYQVEPQSSEFWC